MSFSEDSLMPPNLSMAFYMWFIWACIWIIMAIMFCSKFG